MSDAARWREVMDLDDLWEGDLEGVTVDRHKLILVNVDGEVRAYRDRCPHQAWPLSDGDLDGDVLTCTNHLWEFNAITGDGINPDDCSLFTVSCKVEDGVIYVAPPG